MYAQIFKCLLGIRSVGQRNFFGILRVPKIFSSFNLRFGALLCKRRLDWTRGGLLCSAHVVFIVDLKESPAVNFMAGQQLSALSRHVLFMAKGTFGNILWDDWAPHRNTRAALDEISCKIRIWSKQFVFYYENGSWPLENSFLYCWIYSWGWSWWGYLA